MLFSVFSDTRPHAYWLCVSYVLPFLTSVVLIVYIPGLPYLPDTNLMSNWPSFIFLNWDFTGISVPSGAITLIDMVVFLSDHLSCCIDWIAAFFIFLISESLNILNSNSGLSEIM